MPRLLAFPYSDAHFCPSVAVEPMGSAHKNERVMLKQALLKMRTAIAMAEAQFSFFSCTDRGLAGPYLGCLTPPPSHYLDLLFLLEIRNRNQDDAVCIPIAYICADGGPQSNKSKGQR